MNLSDQFQMSVDPLYRPVSSSPATLTAMRWWQDDQNLRTGMSLGPFEPQMTLYTDASLVSWGAHDADGFQASGT